MSYVAIDAHQNTSTLAYLDPSTGEVGTCKIYTTQEQFVEFFARFDEPCIVAIEACRQSPAVCRWLLLLGAEVHLVDPQVLHELAKLHKAKTDAKDARLMLDALIHGYLPECYLASEEVVAARNLSRARLVLRREATRLCNLIRTWFTQAGADCPVSDLGGKLARENMPAWIAQLPSAFSDIVLKFWRLLKEVWKQLDGLDNKIKKQVRANPVLRALAKRPGLGPILAFSLWAEIGDIDRFETAAQLHSYAGMVPKTMRSDKFQATGKLSNRCNKHLRYASVLGAQCASRCRKPNRVKETYQRIREHCGPNTAKIAGGRKLLTDVLWTWRTVLARSA
jgi:transposase